MFLKSDLIKQIKGMGIAPTDTVLIHTSLRAVGEVENGADGVIDAFKACLIDGLFLVPTHTWGTVTRKHPVYDARTEAPCIGTLPRIAAFRPDGVRSLHPTHSIWATGRGAQDFIAGEENAATPAPPGFAWDRLADVHAKILLIGVGHERNTFIHAVDEHADVPDRLADDSFDVTIINQQGQACTHPFRCHYCSFCPGVSARFPVYENAFIQTGIQTMGQLGNAQVRVVDAAGCRDLLLRIFSRAAVDPCRAYEEPSPQLYL